MERPQVILTNKVSTRKFVVAQQLCTLTQLQLPCVKVTQNSEVMPIPFRFREQDSPDDMTDTEFDVLDELYFVQSFSVLHGQLEIPEAALRETLAQLISKGWVKVLKAHDEEVAPETADFYSRYAGYFYLATKAGLLAHNSR